MQNRPDEFDKQYSAWAGSDVLGMRRAELAERIIAEHNRVADACAAAMARGTYETSADCLAGLSDADLAWFAAGKTLAYGRDPLSCIVNGGCHTCDADSRARYIRNLTTSDPEDSRGVYSPAVQAA